jgi:hypothetical protein
MGGGDVSGEEHDNDDFVVGKFAVGSVSLSSVKVSSPVSVVWSGRQLKPSVILTYDGGVLKHGTGYALSYGANKAIGKGSVTITGKGGVTGKRTFTFNILPKKNKMSKATATKKSVKVSWSKVSAAQKVSGYQLQYKVKGTSKWKTKSFSSKTSKATVKGLRRGKVYQFRIRSFKTVSKVKYCADWSAVKSSKKVK